MKKVFLKISQYSQENTCASLFLSWNFIKKETLAQECSCKFCKVFKNAFFAEHLFYFTTVAGFIHCNN